MQAQLIAIELEEGDVTLVGSDGEVRIFSYHLALIPYFKALKNFKGDLQSTRSYDMKEFNEKNLRAMVGYLYGKFPKPPVKESYLVMLDFLQLDTKELYNTYDFAEVKHLPLKWLIRILPTELDLKEVKSIYKRIVSEEKLDDPEIFNWLEQALEVHKDSWPLCTKYRKLKLIKSLMDNDFSASTNVIKEIGKGKHVPSIIMKLCLRHTFLGKNAFLRYTEWMFEVEQKSKYDVALMEELPREF